MASKKKKTTDNFDCKISRHCEIFQQFEERCFAKGYPSLKAGVLAAMDQFNKADCKCQDDSANPAA